MADRRPLCLKVHLGFFHPREPLQGPPDPKGSEVTNHPPDAKGERARGPLDRDLRGRVYKEVLKLQRHADLPLDSSERLADPLLAYGRLDSACPDELSFPRRRGQQRFRPFCEGFGPPRASRFRAEGGPGPRPKGGAPGRRLLQSAPPTISPARWPPP